MQSDSASLPAPATSEVWRRGFSIRTLLAGCLLIALVHATVTLFLLPAHGDELHFCHAAWLWQHGKQPFSDFIYSYPPGVFWFLSLPNFCGFDDGPSLIVWGRLVAVASLWICSWLLYRIGSQVRNETVGLLAGLLYVPLVVVPYMPVIYSLPHWMVRPETYAMPLCLYGVIATIRCLTAIEPRQLFVNGFLPAAALSVALFISPRAAGIAIGLFFAVLWKLRAVSWSGLAGMCTGAIISVAAYLFFVGEENSYYWVYKYSTSPLPGWTFVPIFRLQMGKFIICSAVAAGLFYLFRRSSPAMSILSLILLISFGCTIPESRPSFASWHVVLPLAAVVFAALLNDLFHLRRVVGPIVAVAAVLLCWCYPMRGFRNNLAVYRQGTSILMRQIEGFEKICQTLGEERVLWNQRSHPIGLFDASYYWTFFKVLPENLPQDPTHKVVPPLDIVGDCLRIKPAVIFEEVLFSAQDVPEESQRLNSLLSTEYDWNGAGFYVRKDKADALTPLFSDPDIRFFAIANYSLNPGLRRAEVRSNR